MAKIFITGSADGLGSLAAKLLVEQGHQVVLHARNEERGKQALSKVPKAENVLTAELSSIEETIQLAAKVNALGSFDAIIHNAGVYDQKLNRGNKDELSPLFIINSLAPYILTCLIEKPKHLIYMSSGMHLQGNANKSRDYTYSDTKLHDLILSMAVAHKYANIYANAVCPGWVPTKMGGKNAPDDLMQGAETQAWLAVSNEATAKVSGNYFFHKKQDHYLPAAKDVTVQEKFLSLCEKITGIQLK